MKEYTVLAVVSVVATIFLSGLVKPNIFKRPEYYFFLAVIFLFKLLVNGYLTANVVLYNPDFFSRIRLQTIPLEDFLFGFSMVTLLIIFWEYFKHKFSR